MKKIIVAGASGYIGGSFISYIAQSHPQYEVIPVSTRGLGWKEMDMSGFDTVYFAAGLAHQKETAQNASLYQAVNCDLALDFAQKAKADGVKQFIYLSSMSVYGINKGKITAQTVPNPTSQYGSSKLAAEVKLSKLACDTFSVAILRPPMVYGKGCKGNYQMLSKIAQRSPVFPNVKNQRSMLYVDNLSEFVRLLVDSGDGGLFFPQNREYVNTSHLVELISLTHGKRMVLIPCLNWLLWLAGLVTSKVDKAFGSLTYDWTMSEYSTDYQAVSFEESVRRTES